MNDSLILGDFEKSLAQLEKALTVSANDDLIKAGCIPSTLPVSETIQIDTLHYHA